MALTETDEGLSRESRKWDLSALLVNATVGAGIFRLPSDVQRLEKQTYGELSHPTLVNSYQEVEQLPRKA